jgi:hypothetical protein
MRNSMERATMRREKGERRRGAEKREIKRPGNRENEKPGKRVEKREIAKSRSRETVGACLQAI